MAQRFKFSDADIRLRSYLIWEREGRPEGRAQYYWLRASAELEAEIAAKMTSFDAKFARTVLPRLPISKLPVRSVSKKIVPSPGPAIAA